MNKCHAQLMHARPGSASLQAGMYVRTLIVSTFCMCIDLEGDSDGSDTEPVTTPVSLCSEMLTLCEHTYVRMYVCRYTCTAHICV